MKMKKILCLLLAILMLSVTGCTGNSDPTEVTSPDTAPSVPTTDAAITDPVENPITYLSISTGENYNSVRSLTAYEENGGTYVEYVGDEKKVGSFHAEKLHRLTEQVLSSGMLELNGRTEYAEGEAFGSAYITYADGSYVSCEFSGVIPAEFSAAYAALDAYFMGLTEALPVYVPTPMIMDGVDEKSKDAILAILHASGMEGLDTLAISNIPMDENFAFSVGLSGAEGIVNGTYCSAMMMTTPYSLVIVTLEDGKDSEAVCDDFAESLDWQKWVCVAPNSALIARKDNMVLCLMGSGTMFSQTCSGILDSGWTEVESLDNPHR